MSSSAAASLPSSPEIGCREAARAPESSSPSSASAAATIRSDASTPLAAASSSTPQAAPLSLAAAANEHGAGPEQYDLHEPTMAEKLASLTLPAAGYAVVVPPSADSVHVLLRQALRADDRAALLGCLCNRDGKNVVKNRFGSAYTAALQLPRLSTTSTGEDFGDGSVGQDASIAHCRCTFSMYGVP